MARRVRADRLDSAMERDAQGGWADGLDFAQTEVGRLVMALDEAGQREAALHLHERLCESRRGRGERAVRAMAGLPLRWTAPEAMLLTGRVTGAMPDVWERTVAMLELPLAALESLASLEVLEALAPADLAEMRARVAQMSRWLPLVKTAKSERAALGRRFDGVLLPDGSGLHWSVLDDDDTYGPRMRAEHGGLLASAGVPALLAHCATLEQVRAGVRWQVTASGLLAAAPRGVEAVRALLGGFTGQPEDRVTFRQSYGEVSRYRGLTGAANTRLVRGLLWVLAGLEEEWAVPLAGQCAMYAGTGVGGSGGESRNGQVATTAVAVLGTFDGTRGEQAVRALAGLRSRVRNRTVLTGADRAQSEVAARAGLTPAQLRERGVPTAGLDADHRREVPLPGGSTAVLSVDPAGTAGLVFVTPEGRQVTSPPASVRELAAQEVTALRAGLKELRGLLSGERSRLEECLASEARWSGADWQRFYVDHPVTGVLAGALVWEVDPGGDCWAAGLPERAGTGWVLAGHDGTATPVRPDDRVRLWHPLRAEVSEVAAWRSAVAARELRQPFKQAFREIYLLTPAELETDGYSNRFAAHILRFGQARALMAARGWSAGHLGYWDGGYEGEAVRQVPTAGPESWRARFDFQLVEEHDRGDVADLCSSNRVRFEYCPKPGGRWAQIRMAEVPALVLSEAMRDVDLFVGVASIAADPQWQDADGGRHMGYWHRVAFGPLPPSAEVRREALAALLPKTGIADRVELTGRFLRVRGDLATYRIHLGSANVLVEPNDSYLCIVPARKPAAGRVFLPFEEDGGLLSVLLSKAFLLADDAAITDPSIVSQLPVRVS